MSDSGNGLLLNVTEQLILGGAYGSKVNRKSWKYKKQVRKDAPRGPYRTAAPHKVIPSRPVLPPTANTLKGYQLSQTKEEGSPPGAEATKLVDAPVVQTNLPGKLRNDRPNTNNRQQQMAKGGHTTSEGGDHYSTETAPQRPQTINSVHKNGAKSGNKQDHKASGSYRKRQRDATPDSDALVGGSDDDDSGEVVRDAVAAVMSKEAALKVDTPEQQAQHEEEEAGVVEFWDSKDNGNFRTRKKQKKKETKTAVREKGVAYPAATTLAHASTTIPQSSRADLFGEVDTSSFEGLGLAQQLAQHLEDINFVSPTLVQQQSIPILLAGHDALINAPTGSGKTLCYLAPIVNSLQAVTPRINRGDGTYAVVVSPTRELALQIYSILSLILRRYHWLVGGAILGGENRNHEKQRLRKGVTVLVATPGRLLDHLTNSVSFKTEELRWLVLDEADRLLDLGFTNKLAEICGILDQRLEAAGHERRQTVLLSATLHPHLDTLATLSLRQPKLVGFSATSVEGKLVISSDEGQAKEGATPADDTTHKAKFDIPKQLKQRYMEVPCKLRLAALAALIKARCNTKKDAKIVVFMSSCDAVEFHSACFTDVYEQLYGEPLLGCEIFKMHGLMPQGERTASFVGFTSCQSGVLIATDVAARGVDFPAVTTCVQVDPPGEPAEYVHRVGRTARMGAAGESVLLLMPHELSYVEALKEQGVHITPESLEPLLDWLIPQDFNSKRRIKGRTLESHEGAFQFQRSFMSAVEGDKKLMQLAMDAFRSFVRAYSTHATALKSIFHIKKLHLGHVAHAFALKESPSLIGSSNSKAQGKRKKQQAAQNNINRNRSLMKANAKKRG